MPRDQIQLPRAQGPVDLELPPRDTAVAVQHPDGTPLWVVHRKDGTVSVFSAVVSIGRTNPHKDTVSWRPTLRRFDHQFAYDDHGRNLGRIECGGCTFAPNPPDHPHEEFQDLDSFDVARLPGSPQRIRLGDLRQGVKHRVPRQLLPGALKERWESAVPAPKSIAEALLLPEGTTLRVDGVLVRASGELPRICADVDREECCPANAPPLHDVDGIPLSSSGPVVMNHQLFLLRRYRDGFVQYETGKPLDVPLSYATLPKPPGYDTWDLRNAPPRSICK